MPGAEGNGKPLHYHSLVNQLMEKSHKATAPSARRPFNGTGVRRIPGRSFRLGTWNVCSLKSPEKVYNVTREMKRLNVDVLGVSEVRWRGNGKHHIDDEYVLYYSGSDDSKNKYGVGVIVNSKNVRPVAFVPKSNRTMMLTIEAKPRNINIVQLYAPTTDGSDRDMEEFYAEVEELMRIMKKHEINIVMGDMNAKVGAGEVPGVVGSFGLGERNARGDMLVQFCQEQDLAIMNTYFRLPARRLYTWTSPRHTKDHIVRNQIDFIMVNRRFRNCIKNAKTYPGTDVRSDHNPVIAEFACVLKKLRKKQGSRWADIRMIAEAGVRSAVHNEINKWAVETKQGSSNSVEEIWSELKGRVHNINKVVLKPKNWVPKQSWMNNKIYNLMEERRMQKGIDKHKYDTLDRQIRREVRYARNSWYREKCLHVEKLQMKHDAFNLHKEIKDMVGKKTPTYQLWDDNNRPVTNQTEKMHLWEQYIKQMFADDTRSLGAPPCDLDGCPILKDEVISALQRSKTGKSPGPDEVHIEVLKLIEHEHIDSLTGFMNLIYDTGHLPEDWLKSVFVTLPKKPNAKRCEEFRTISLMSQVLKLFLTIIHERIRAKCDEQLGDSQFGFRAGVGTREALFAVHVLVQKCKDMQKDVYLCFVDYEKAFDRVLHDRLLSILNDIGLNGKDIRIIQNLYWNQRAAVRVEGDESENVHIKRGVRQGCILSPTLFNLYSEAIISNALADLDCGVKINGRNINNLRYADDTVLIAFTESDLQLIVDRLSECSENAGLRMNALKTKVMVVSKQTNLSPSISVAGKRLELVQKYKYLGTWLTQEWDSNLEIKTRIEISRSAFNKMRKIISNRNINISLRNRLIQCYIWPIALYGCEAWTIKEDLGKRLEAFEMWLYRRMLSISWTQKVTNVEVLRRVGQDRKFMQTIKQRKVAYLGHIFRHERYDLLQLIMMGKVAGKRGVGRRKKSWLRNIREWTGITSAAELFHLAKTRRSIRS